VLFLFIFGIPGSGPFPQLSDPSDRRELLSDLSDRSDLSDKKLVTYNPQPTTKKG